MHLELRLIQVLACVGNRLLNITLRLLKRREQRAYAKHRKYEIIYSTIGKTGLKNAKNALEKSIASDEKLLNEIRRINSLTNTIQNLQEDFSDMLQAAY